MNKLKGRGSSETQEKQEPTFGILPHPAVSTAPILRCSLKNDSDLQKTNNPADLAPQPGAGLNSGHAHQAHHAHGPVIPNQNSLEQPAVRTQPPSIGEC